MIYYLSHAQINKSRWDACIDESRNSLIYAYSWYLDIVSPQWEALVLDDYKAVFALTCKKKLGMNYLAQPMFAQQLGIFSVLEISQELIQAFLHSIPSKFIHLDIALNSANNLVNFSHVTDHTNLLDLHTNYQLISQGYSGNTKRNLKKSMKHPLEWIKCDLEESVSMYKKYVWLKTPGFKIKDFDTFRTLCDSVNKHQDVLSIGINYQGEICAAGIFFKTTHRLIFILGAASSMGRKLGAMRFLFDRLIHQYSNQTMILDFEGSHASNVNYVYAGFGTSRIQFPIIRKTSHVVIRSALHVKQSIQLTTSSFAHKLFMVEQ